MGQRELKSWLQEAPLLPTTTSHAPVVDMSNLPAEDILQDILDRGTDLGLRLKIEGFEIMSIPPQPGAEPLHKAHLYQKLRDMARNEFIPAMALSLIRSTLNGGFGCYKS
jgi:hypothetical protein